MNMPINQSRAQLDEILVNFLELIETRRSVLQQILEEKSKYTFEGTFAFYDAERELEMFDAVKDKLQFLSLKEAFALSLIIEDQVGMKYPQWSEEVHLARPYGQSWAKINPLILYFVRPILYKQLDLTDDFKKLYASILR